jgi:hypothetical protein
VLREWVTRPKLLPADRCARGTIATLVILSSAGTGFLANRLWPLPTFLAPTLKANSSGTAVLKEHNDIRSAPPALADRNVPSTKGEPVDVTENPAGAPFVLLNPGTAEQPREVKGSTLRPTAKSLDESAEQQSPQTGPAGSPREEKVPSPQLARGQRKHRAEANLAQPAPGPTGYQRDAAMRDFMSHNPPFRH